jgi:molybdate transport repressor ModE-like protein
MRHSLMSLSGNINISYNGDILIGELQYRLLNLLLTDNLLETVALELKVSYPKAVEMIKEMNRIAPDKVIHSRTTRNGKEFYICDYGMKLMNAFAQKEFELYIFLQKSNTQLSIAFEEHAASKTTYDIAM